MGHSAKSARALWFQSVSTTGPLSAREVEELRRSARRTVEHARSVFAKMTRPAARKPALQRAKYPPAPRAIVDTARHRAENAKGLDPALTRDELAKVKTIVMRARQLPHREQ
ncbi:MAG: hypothetical protein ACRENK_08265 [Gemmatimonadaceae bacterium]